MLATRRDFIAVSATVVTCSNARSASGAQGRPSGKAGTPVARPTLPYPAGALAPTLSEEAVRLHFGAHHAGYYNRLSALLGPGMATTTLEDLILQTHGTPEMSEIHAAAGQLFTHNFYWASLRPSMAARPPQALENVLERDFGGLNRMQEQLITAAQSMVGSGWAWLVQEANGRVSVITTSNADTPLPLNLKPLLAVDVWEHAYYLDYRNRRSAHLAAVVGDLLNWDFAAANLWSVA